MFISKRKYNELINKLEDITARLQRLKISIDETQEEIQEIEEADIFRAKGKEYDVDFESKIIKKPNDNIGYLRNIRLSFINDIGRVTKIRADALFCESFKFTGDYIELFNKEGNLEKVYKFEKENYRLVLMDLELYKQAKNRFNEEVCCEISEDVD